MKVKEIWGLGSLLGVVGVVFFGGCLEGGGFAYEVEEEGDEDYAEDLFALGGCEGGGGGHFGWCW